MNFLILTPDGVGSTILQRLLTIAFYLENIKIYNTHELTNGLIIKDGVLSKDYSLKYSQQLCDIIDIISNSNKETVFVSRLAKYHLDARNDEKKSKKQFYIFLNKFYGKKIICVRKNIFEYAMSWSIRQKSGILNLYKKIDKERVSTVTEVDEEFFMQKCKEYINYLYWANDNFPISEQIAYEDMVTNTDSVIDNLTGFKKTFIHNFDVELTKILRIEYDFLNHNSAESSFKYNSKEQRALYLYKSLSDRLVDEKIILNLPIKNTTLQQKKKQIKNFDSCRKKFENFARQHNFIDQTITNWDFWDNKFI